MTDSLRERVAKWRWERDGMTSPWEDCLDDEEKEDDMKVADELIAMILPSEAGLREAIETFIKTRGIHAGPHVYDPSVQNCQACEISYIEAEAILDAALAAAPAEEKGEECTVCGRTDGTHSCEFHSPTPSPDAKDERIRNLEKAFAMATDSRNRLWKRLNENAPDALRDVAQRLLAAIDRAMVEDDDLPDGIDGTLIDDLREALAPASPAKDAPAASEKRGERKRMVCSCGVMRFPDGLGKSTDGHFVHWDATAQVWCGPVVESEEKE
jgi:hypothetical protein